MKKIIILLLLFTCSFEALAQNHIKFMGIPLEQQLHQFVFQLKQKGFKDGWNNSLEEFLEQYNMKGKFLGIREQDIIIQCVDKTVIGVIVPYHYESWKEAFNQYSTLKAMLTQKYGKPNKCVEKFLTNPIPKDDKSKFLAVKSEKCNYSSVFNVDSGRIEVSISNGSNAFPRSLIDVGLEYWDDSPIKTRRPIDDL